ncbi:hypothetical protein PMAYCL1PPCAC_19659, partial [Pristionchus mayeri]
LFQMRIIVILLLAAYLANAFVNTDEYIEVFTQREYKFGVKKDAPVGTVIGRLEVTAVDTSNLEFMVGDERVVNVDNNGTVSLNGPVIPSPYRTPAITFQGGRILDEATLVIEYSDGSSTSTSSHSSTHTSSHSSTTSSKSSSSPSFSSSS